jgi:transketolase
MRDILSSFLSNKAVEEKNFFVMSGDHGYALFDEIRKKAPHQFINTGVTEQATVGAAAGMAKTGKRVVIYGLASFIPIRVLEFIKMNICYENLPVIILGDGAGVVYSTLGASHQCGEDIAALRTLPIKIYSPADKIEMELCLEQAYAEKRPCYIRIGKSDKPSIHKTKNPKILSACFPVLKNQSSVALFATGSMVSTALELGKMHNIDVYSCPVLTFHSNDELAQTLSQYKLIISIEEHSVHGGLGSIVADAILENELTVRLKRHGITQYFTKGCGSYNYAIQFHKLDLESLSLSIKSYL